MIRAARCNDVAALPLIERAAGAAFREVGMAVIAEDEPLPVGELLCYQCCGRAWVATDGEDQPVAYLLLDAVEDAAHIEQVSVHPRHARQGIGRALINEATEWARQRRLPGLR